eukprot:scaffold13634_cov67-Phaeocystis_antarctica.AAC.1
MVPPQVERLELGALAQARRHSTREAHLIQRHNLRVRALVDQRLGQGAPHLHACDRQGLEPARRQRLDQLGQRAHLGPVAPDEPQLAQPAGGGAQRHQQA